MARAVHTRGGQRLAAAFEAVERTPALLHARERVLGANGEGTSPDSVITAVEGDPGLAIAVMRAANSGRSNGKAPAAAISEAVVNLGVPRIQKIVSGIDTFDFLESGNGQAAALERFRVHALGTQGAADAVARRIGMPDREQLRLAALLHDVGKLVIVRLRRDDARRGSKETPEERAAAERRELGIDHALVGGVLARRWGLPRGITAAIERHHSDDAPEHARVIRLADLLAHHAQGAPIATAGLRAAARSCGINRDTLEELVYDRGIGSDSPSRVTEPSPLSVREMEVLRFLAEGKVYKQIALELALSVSTVRTHLHNVYAKLGVIDRAQAVLTATDKGWI
jgi:putative nucleotidyltransferase with HDIG domain